MAGRAALERLRARKRDEPAAAALQIRPQRVGEVEAHEGVPRRARPSSSFRKSGADFEPLTADCTTAGDGARRDPAAAARSSPEESAD
jgi:hypothetical protein